jgi:hypothetical protein
MKPWLGETAEDVRDQGPHDFSGFEVLQDSRIIDLRDWNPKGSGKLDTTSEAYGYRRLKVVKLHGNVKTNNFRINVLGRVDEFTLS